MVSAYHHIRHQVHPIETAQEVDYLGFTPIQFAINNSSEVGSADRSVPARYIPSTMPRTGSDVRIEDVRRRAGMPRHSAGAVVHLDVFS